MKNGRCRMHGGTSPGAPKGNRNAWKHGQYSAEAIATRHTISALIRFSGELGAKVWAVYSDTTRRLLSNCP